MNTKLLFSFLISAAIGFISFSGCSNPAAATNPGSNNQDQTISKSTYVENDLGLLKTAGVNFDSSQGCFSIGWNQIFFPPENTDRLTSGAFAIGFTAGETPSKPFLRSGVDMGSVYLNYAGNQLQFNKQQAPDGGYFYSIMPTPNQNDMPIEFVANGSYDFQVTGSPEFSAITFSLTAPSSLINITSPAEGTVINPDEDLTVSWQGGNANGHIVIRLMPSIQPPQGGGGQGHGNGNPPPHGNGNPPNGNGGHGPHPMPGHDPDHEGIVITLQSNPGQYTIPSSKIQEFLNQTSANFMVVGVGQFNESTVAHDNGTLRAVMRNGDGVGLQIQQ